MLRIDAPTAGDQRRTAAEQMLDRELGRLVASGDYAAWFAEMAKLHTYSPGNQALLLAQAAERGMQISRVASYRTWQQLGRQVRKGERGLMVWHPKPYWVDAATGERVRPPTTVDQQARRERRVSFSIGWTFDQTQTDGEPLELGGPAPADAPDTLVDHLGRWCDSNRIAVDTRRLPAGLYGYYQRDRDRIVLAAGLSPGERTATLAHELAHRQDPALIEADAAGDVRYYAHNRPDCEAVAEAAAHSLSARFGHDITAHSAGYIATWVAGDVDRFKQLHDRVGQVARTLIPPDRLDLALDTARTKAAEQSAERRPARRRR